MGLPHNGRYILSSRRDLFKGLPADSN